MTLTYPSGRLVQPGPGIERYPVAAGGASVMQLAAGDTVELVDVHGGQAAEVLALGPSGQDRFAGSGLSTDGPAVALHALATSAHPDADLLLACLSTLGVNPVATSAAHAFGPGSHAGGSVRFTVDAAATLVVIAPGGPMTPDGAGLATELAVFIYRASVPESAPADTPALLAEPSLDLIVDASSARTYEVKAGDYIQVVDLEGRQCSDFMAFNRRSLDAGVERGIDTTATRTLMGRTIPAPGLYSKFYDADMRALVEVVRDTVGRHDTFGFACTSKYYEDRGYFGHRNCSDNFNAVLEHKPD